MKKNLISALSSTLAVIMLLGCLASCASGTTDETSPAAATSEENQTEAVTEAPETEDPAYVCDLPDNLNFGGKTVKMLVDNYKYSSDEFYAPEQSGSVISDTVYSRNLLVQEKLGITLEVNRVATTSDKEVAEAIKTSVAAGDRLYDIATIPGYRSTQYIKGNYRNLIGVENLNLDKAYWTQGFNDIMRLGNKQYLASGSYSLSMVRGMYVTLYSKDKLTEWNLKDPIDMVNSGTWTIENQAAMLKDVYSDLNGNLTRDYDDFYGFGGTCYSTSDPYWVSWNLPFLSITDSEEYTIEIDNDKFDRIINTYHDFLFNNSGTYCICTGSKDDRGVYAAPATIELFAAGRAAMVTVEISLIELNVAGQYSGDYSIAPLPKLDADQEKYYSHVSDRLTCMVIVSTVPDEELPMMGAFMEKITSESYKTVFPTFYEQVLTYRYLQNIESKKMLDLMFNGIRIEGAFLYASYFSLLTDTRKLFASAEGAASFLTSSATKWKASAKSLNKLFDTLE